MRMILLTLAILALAVPAAGAAPPEGKGKPAKVKAPVTQPGEEKNASKRCKAERARLGAQAFADKYGTNANKRNAFGKCVSGANKAKKDDDEADGDDADDNAAKLCKAEQQRLGAQAFADKYGTNANKRNAFGKCVSQKSKQKQTG